MVLQGAQEGQSPPFDASLYNASTSPSTPAREREIAYEDCEAVSAIFATTPEVTDVLPEGITPYSDPPTAGVFVTHYPFSTVGEYKEVLTVIQVEDLEGELAYYIPYIYVTDDAALAAGREMAGAPKKLAAIDLDVEGSIANGSMERPRGTELLSLSVKPERRAVGGLVETLLDGRLPLLSIRHLPPIEGGDGCTQLVKWYADFDFHEDARGRPKRWLGPHTLEYPDRSAVDPVDTVAVEDELAGLYAQFDMALGVTEVHDEWVL